MSDAIEITGGQNLVDQNIILGHAAAGVHVIGPPPNGVNNTILQNWLGIDNLSNCGANQDGVWVDNGAFNTTIQQNYISCNTRHGVFIDSLLGDPTIPPVTMTTIDRNAIGLDIAGTAAKPNQQSGVYDYQGLNTILKMNVISGNTLDGITLDGSQAPVVTNQNLVGTDTNGLAAVPNGGAGSS